MTTYSFLDVKAGIVGLGGALSFGDGAGASEEGITIEPVVDSNNMATGSDGTPQHSLSANKSGRVTVRLLKTSIVNQMLMVMYDLQISVGRRFHGKNVISVVNQANGEATLCRAVAFKKRPSQTFAQVAGITIWEFDAGIVDTTPGFVPDLPVP